MRQKIIWLLIISGFLLMRLFNILALPLYIDEGLYIFWAKLFSQSSEFAYVSLQDGKTPLFIWLTAWINPLFNNYLLTGRFISLVAGLITAISWMVLTDKLFSRKVSVWFGILMVVVPYAVLINRMSFVDSLLTMFGSLSLLFFYYCFSSFKEKHSVSLIAFFAFLSGLSLGLGFLTKTSAKVFLAAQILIAVYWAFVCIKQKNFKDVFKIAASVFIISVIFFEITGYLKIGAHRFWGEIAIKEHQLTYSISEVITRILMLYKQDVYGHYFKNLYTDLQYFLVYFSFLLIPFISGIWSIFRERKHIWVIMYLTLLFLAVLFFGKVTASRYFYICVPAFVAISALGIEKIYEKRKIIVIGVLILTFLQSFIMVINPIKAFYSKDDKGYLLSSNLSALGLRESIDIIKPQAQNSIVGVSGMWGVLEGSQVILETAGIENVNADKWLLSSELDENDTCQRDWKKVDNICWKTNIDNLLGSNKEYKYLYLTRGKDRIDILEKFYTITVERIFDREDSEHMVYLIRLNQ